MGHQHPFESPRRPRSQPPTPPRQAQSRQEPTIAERCRGRQHRAPTRDEIAAVQQFHVDGDIGALKQRIGTTDRTYVNGLVTRVTGYLGMMARPAPREPSARSQNMNANRLRVALEQLGHDPQAFFAIYDSLPGSRQRTIREPSAIELASVEEFVRTGDAHVLRSKLPRKDRAYLNAVVTRVLAWKAQKGRPA